MVVKGSVARKPGDLQVRFVLTDFAHQVPVEYTGVLPDLFREGQGIIAHGTMGPTAPSSPTRCSPSTMRNTCRPEVAASLKQKAASAAPAGAHAPGADRTPSGLRSQQNHHGTRNSAYSPSSSPSC